MLRASVMVARWAHNPEGRFDSEATQPNFCPGGVMVATLVLEASAERRVGSSPTWGTILKHIQFRPSSKGDSD